MSRTIKIDPITRIEGHARVEVEIDDNDNVTGALFRILDFRGFETFLQGMQVEMMPTVTSRVCGTCPHSHHLASAHTLDKVFSVQPPRAAVLLRTALNLGSILHSHGVHFFALAGPDLLLGLDAPPAERNILGLLKAAPDVAKKALRIRTIGQKITETIGGRGTHPVSCVAGGLATPLGTERCEMLKSLVSEAVPLGVELVNVAKEVLNTKRDLVTSLTEPTHYLGTVNNGALDLMHGALRMRKSDASCDYEFAEDDWRSHLQEEALETSYAKRVVFLADTESFGFRVGPLARLNVCDAIDTPLAQAELEAFRAIAGHPCHQTVMYHYARLVELLYAAEKLQQIIADPEIVSDNVRTSITSTPQSATGHIEAPRGTLIHDYDVDKNGIVTCANLIVATQQNIDAINATVALSAKTYLDKPDDMLLNGIEFGIRCYDPCLSCATHRLGEMKLDVIVSKGGKIQRRARR